MIWLSRESRSYRGWEFLMTDKIWYFNHLGLWFWIYYCFDMQHHLTETYHSNLFSECKGYHHLNLNKFVLRARLHKTIVPQYGEVDTVVMLKKKRGWTCLVCAYQIISIPLTYQSTKKEKGWTKRWKEERGWR